MMHNSAGIVVIGKEHKVAIVSQHGDSWSLPKGHLEEGEVAIEAALRETTEETGLRQVKIIKKLGEYVRPRIGKGGVGDVVGQFKRITLFLGTTTETELTPEDPDNPEARWVSIDEICDYLTHQKDIDFFTSVIPEIKEYLAA